MLSPKNDMPPLADQDLPFDPPSPGVSERRQPEFFYPFPGPAAAQQQNLGWSSGYPPGTPFSQSTPAFSSWSGSPSAGPQPNGAAGWSFQQHYSPFSNTPALSWGAQTPAGSYISPLTPGGQSSALPFGSGVDGYPPQLTPVFGASGQDGITSGDFFGASLANGQGLGVERGEPPKKERKQRKRATSMKRSASGGPAMPTQPIRRSNSLGNAASSPPEPNDFGCKPRGYYLPPQMTMMNGVVCGPENLGRRLQDWREDYTPQWLSDNTQRLHPLLQYDPQSPPIHDLRKDPLTVEPGSMFLNIGRPCNNIDFVQLATMPPSSFMRLFHPLLPWCIDVHPTHPNGVTVYDVLAQMYRQLRIQITRQYWNEDLTDDDRKAIALAFWGRCRGNWQETQRGVVRVDFIRKKVIFKGLVKGRGGMWKIKTSPYE